MAEPPGYDFAAIRQITVNGVIAYNPGDLVHESAVEGPGAWLILGVDVEPRPGAKIAMPPRNASQAVWAAYAVTRGADADEAAGMSRAQLAAAYGEA